jgi:signal transduction histidine kinase
MGLSLNVSIALQKWLTRAGDAMRPRGPLANETTARVLHWLLVGLLIWFALYISIILPFFNIKKALSALLAVFGILTWVVALVLMRRGLLRWAALVYLSAMYVSATLLMVLYGGIRSPATVLYMSLPISAAWLLGQRAALVSAIACLSSAFILALLETTGFRIHPYFPGTPFGIWALILLATIVSAAPVVLVLGILQEALSRSRILSSRLLALQDEERRRIARGLHDSVAQDIAALGMNLSTLEQEGSTLSSKALGVISESIAMADRCIDEIRTFAYLLHPPGLDRLGLRAALRWYTDGFATRSGIRVETLIPPDLPRMSGPTETAIFRIVQESLANIHTHSGSKIAWIRITRVSEELVVEVEDEGRGLPAGMVSGSGRPLQAGVGLASMTERMRELGGRLEFLERRPCGTIVRAVLPSATRNSVA